MADTAIRLCLDDLTNVEAIYYTVPVSTTTIIRSIRLINSTAGNVTVVMSIGADAIDTRIIADAYVIPPHSDFDWSGFIVMNDSETLRATASANTAITLTASGVEVT